jgi:hypothetical protein
VIISAKTLTAVTNQGCRLSLYWGNPSIDKKQETKNKKQKTKEIKNNE